MRKSILAGSVLAVCASVVIVGCGAQASMTTFMKGSWDCNGQSSDEQGTVVVGDGTFSFSSNGQTAAGTWDVAFGDLTVTMTSKNEGFRGGVLKDFPSKNAPQGSFSSMWGLSHADGSSRDAGTLAVSVEGKKVRLVFTDPDSGDKTTTTCVKK